MKWTMPYAALLAALVLALGLVEVTRPTVAAADSDEVMIMPPGTRGDPDDGGGIYSWSRWLRPVRQLLLRVGASPARQSMQAGPPLRLATRQTSKAPR